MFSTGHIMWITISAVLVLLGLVLCKKKSPSFEKLLRWCFTFGILSEFVKIFSVINVLPIVEPVISGDSVSYVVSGTYSPYIEIAHLPLELCSLQILFYAIYIWINNPKWRKRFRALIFITGTIGGTLGIVMAYIASEYDTAIEFFSYPRAWQYFLFHAMTVAVGIYAGFGNDSTVSYADIKGVFIALISLDVASLYLNSIFSEPVYINEKPVGLLYRANFMSSYVNPIGLTLTKTWQWAIYLGVRFTIASLLILLLFVIQKKIMAKNN